MQHTIGILNDDVRHGSQSWTREMTVSMGAHKVRATVKRDSYPHQSDIHVDVFSPVELKWNRLETLSGKDHDDLEGAYSDKDDAILRSSESVIQRLLGYAELVLS